MLFLVQDVQLLRMIGYSFFLLFMAFVVVKLFQGLIGRGEVDRESIMAALSIYLLFGLIGALLAGIIDVAFDNAYSISTVDSGLLWNNFLYYSFVTLTTLGYGDITPIIDESKALALLLSIVGPFYLATVIAILVSKLSIARSEARSEAGNEQ